MRKESNFPKNIVNLFKMKVKRVNECANGKTIFGLKVNHNIAMVFKHPN